MIAKKKSSENLMRPARLVDVAKRAGVSTSVAGAILNGGTGNSRAAPATVERVREAAAALHYKPHLAARLLRGTRSNTYGVLVASAGDPLRSFLVEYLDSEAVKMGGHTIICNTTCGRDVAANKKRFMDAIHTLHARGVDGIICAVHDWWPGDRKILMEMHPNTVFYEDPGIKGAAYVEVEQCEVARLAVRHLGNLGHQKIGLIIENGSSVVGQQRLVGLKDELNVLGLPFEKSQVFSAGLQGWACGRHDPETDRWFFPEKSASKALDQLLGEGVDAIITPNDYWAAVLVRILRARGIGVPDDVAVVGYFNHYLADWTDPPLTSISPNYIDSAKSLMAMLEKMISGKLRHRHKLTQPHIILREST